MKRKEFRYLKRFKRKNGAIRITPPAPGVPRIAALIENGTDKLRFDEKLNGTKCASRNR